MVRLTIRATDETVPPVLFKLMEERLGVGMSTAVEKYQPPTHAEISDAFGNVMVN
jgi:AP-2 complex subunit alpha